MATPNKRRVDQLPAYTQGGDIREVQLPKGFLEQGLILSGTYTHTPTADGTALREFPCPVRRIQVIGDGGKVLHDVRVTDLIREAMIYEQTPVASMITAPGTITLAGGAKSGSFAIPLRFREPFANVGDATSLPTWIYETLTLKIECGDRTDVVRGGTGAIGTVVWALTAAGVQEDFRAHGNPFEWGSKLSVALRSFREFALDGTAEPEKILELPRTAKFRSIVVVAEDANGDGSDAIVNALTLEINNNLRQYNRAPYAAVRLDNAHTFGCAMPAGVAILEFAEDKDIFEILDARAFTSLNLIVDRNAAAGARLRVFMKRVEEGRGARAA